MRRLRPLLGLLTAFLLWEVAALTAGTRALPTPVAVAWALVGLIQSATLPRALGLTLGHTSLGVGAALGCGIPLGLWMGRSQVVRTLLTPIMELVRPLPPPALIPPAMLLLGFGPGLYMP